MHMDYTAKINTKKSNEFIEICAFTTQMSLIYKAIYIQFVTDQA